MKKGYLLADEVLHCPDLRGRLYRHIPQLAKLEDLFGSENVELTSAAIDRRNISSAVTLTYDVFATPDLYPHVRTKLINARVIKRGDVESARCGNRRRPNECESLHLVFNGGNTEVFLTVYNPSYKTR